MSEQLLYTLSTLGATSLEHFNNAFSVLFPLLQVDEDNKDLKKVRRQFIRLLSSLGHCEFDFGYARKVYVCQPYIVSLPGRGLARAVLTGARSPSLIKALRSYVADKKDYLSISGTRQTVHSPFLGGGGAPSFELPLSLVFEATDPHLLKGLAEAVGVSTRLGTPAAWSQIMFSVGLSDIEASLVFEGFRDLGQHGWTTKVFDPGTLTFTPDTAGLPRDGLIEYKDRYEQLRHIIKDGGSEAVVDRDWGRYLILANNERQVLHYDDRRQLLIVPSTVPLPNLLARAATLCSGLAPLQGHVTGGTPGKTFRWPFVDVYRAVPYAIARRLSEKLGQGLPRLEENYLEVAN